MSHMTSQKSIETLQPGRFLKTNLQEYFKCEEDRCISCSECLKGQDKLLQYKYPPTLKSGYQAEYHKFDPNAKSPIFNLDNEKLKLKIPYKVPRDFTSTSKAEYRPYQVTAKPMQKPHYLDKEMNNPCFIGATTYNKTYVNWGASGALKPQQVAPTFIDMKIQDRTTYKDTYHGKREVIPEFIREHEDLMKKQNHQKMVKGSLARHVEVPFMG